MNSAFLLSNHSEQIELCHTFDPIYPDLTNENAVAFYKNTPLPKDTGKHCLLRLVNDGGDCFWPDYRECALGWTLVSSNFRDLLIQHAEDPGYYQFIDPLYHPDSADTGTMRYQWMNLLDHVPSLDLTHSRYKTKDDGQRTMYEYVLRHEAVEGGCDQLLMCQKGVSQFIKFAIVLFLLGCHVP